MSKCLSSSSNMPTSCYILSCTVDALLLVSQLCDDLSFFRALLLACKQLHSSLQPEKMRRTKDILGVVLSQCKLCDKDLQGDFVSLPVSSLQHRALLFFPFFVGFASRLRYAAAWVWSLYWTTLNTFSDGLDIVVSSNCLNSKFYLLHAYWIALYKQHFEIELREEKLMLKATDSFEHNVVVGSHPNVLPPFCRPNGYNEHQCKNLHRLRQYLVNNVRLIQWMCDKSIFGETGNKTTQLQAHLSVFCDALNNFFNAYERQPTLNFYALNTFDYATTARWIVEHSSSPLCTTKTSSKILIVVDSDSDSDFASELDSGCSTKRRARKKMRTESSFTSTDEETLPKVKRPSRMSHSQKDPCDHLSRRPLRHFRL